MYLSTREKETEGGQGQKNPCFLNQESGSLKHERMWGEGRDVTLLCPEFPIEIWMFLQRNRNVKCRGGIMFYKLAFALPAC